MNRLLIAFIAALGLHGLLFFTPFTGPAMRAPRPLSFQKISVSLADSKKPVFRRNNTPLEEKIEEKKTHQPIKDKKRIPKKPETQPPSPVDHMINTLQPIQKKQISPQIVKAEVPVLPVEKEEKLFTESESFQETDFRKDQAFVEEMKNNQQQYSSSAARIQKAVPLHHINVPPPYPRVARHRGMEGLVEINVFVDINGKVKEQRLVQSSGYSILDRAAVKAVRKWKFSPGIKDGKPSEMWVKVPVRFQLIDK